MDNPYIKVYEGVAYDGRLYYISYVNMEEVPYSEEFSEYQKGAACPVIPGISSPAYSYDYERFLRHFIGNI